MDDFKIFVKKEKELESLIQTLRIYSKEIEMEFKDWIMCHADNKKGKQRKELTNKMINASEHLEKKKITDTWKY